MNAVIDLLHVLSDEDIPNLFDLFSRVVLVLKVHGSNRSKICVGRVENENLLTELRFNITNRFINVISL